MENNELYCFGDLPVSALMSADDLEHSGIKGMRWGVRRYQNKDGSLTPAGKKRYNQELANIRAAEKVLKTKQATKAKIDRLNARKKAVEEGEAELNSVSARTRLKAKKNTNTDVEVTPKKKTAKDMTDAELRDAVNRMQLEKQFNTLHSELNPKKVSAGKEFMAKLGKNMLDSTAEAAKNAARGFLDKKLKEVLGLNEEKSKSAYEKLKEEVEMLDMKKRYSDHKKDNSLKDKADKLELEKKILANEIAIRNMKSKK